MTLTPSSAASVNDQTSKIETNTDEAVSKTVPTGKTTTSTVNAASTGVHESNKHDAVDASSKHASECEGGIDGDQQDHIAHDTLEELPLPKSYSTVGSSNFRVLRMLGKGAVGKVYLVKSQGLANGDGYFALKKLDKHDMVARQKVQRVLNEQYVLAMANHPFVVTLHYCFQTTRSLYLVMQFCAGGEFYQLQKSQAGGVFTENQARFYASEILLALEYLHVMGFVYRDLKSDNILVHGSGHIMLADFDLSYIAKDDKSSGGTITPNTKSWCPPFSSDASDSCMGLGGGKGRRRGNTMSAVMKSTSRKYGQESEFHLDTERVVNMDRTMSFVGTDPYMAPEVIKGNSYSGMVDWWSYGILIFEMLIGDMPFRGQDQVHLFAEIIDKDQPVEFPSKAAYAKLHPSRAKLKLKPARLSRQCKHLIRALLTKNPKKRLTDPQIIKRKAWFKGVKWALVRNQTPPIIPKLSSEGDHSYFPSLASSDDSGSVFKDGGISVDIGSRRCNRVEEETDAAFSGNENENRDNEDVITDDEQEVGLTNEVADGYISVDDDCNSAISQSESQNSHEDSSKSSSTDEKASAEVIESPDKNAKNIGKNDGEIFAKKKKKTSNDATLRTGTVTPPPRLATPALDRGASVPTPHISSTPSSSLFGDFRRFARDVDPHWASSTRASPIPGENTLAQPPPVVRAFTDSPHSAIVRNSNGAADGVDSRVGEAGKDSREQKTK